MTCDDLLHKMVGKTVVVQDRHLRVSGMLRTVQRKLAPWDGKTPSSELPTHYYSTTGAEGLFAPEDVYVVVGDTIYLKVLS